jgi:hypothetical protein
MNMQVDEKNEIQRLDEYLRGQIAQNSLSPWMELDDLPEKTEDEKFFDSLVLRAFSGEELPCWMIVVQCLNEGTRPSSAQAKMMVKTIVALRSDNLDRLKIMDVHLRKAIADNTNIINGVLIYLGICPLHSDPAEWVQFALFAVKTVNTAKAQYLADLIKAYPNRVGYNIDECNRVLNNGNRIELPSFQQQLQQRLQQAGVSLIPQLPQSAAEPERPGLSGDAVRAEKTPPANREFLDPEADLKKVPLRRAIAAAEEAMNNNKGNFFTKLLVSAAHAEAKAQAAMRFTQLKQLAGDHQPNHTLTACIRVILKFLRDDKTPLDRDSHAYCLMQHLAPLISENFNFAALVAKEKLPVNIRNSFCAQLEQKYCKYSISLGVTAPRF